MSRKASARAPNDIDASIDRPAVPAEIIFLGVVLVLTAFFTLAGIPGQQEPVAGDGSERLRRNWLEQRASAIEDPATTVDADAEDTPLDAEFAPGR